MPPVGGKLDSDAQLALRSSGLYENLSFLSLFPAVPEHKCAAPNYFLIVEKLPSPVNLTFSPHLSHGKKFYHQECTVNISCHVGDSTPPVQTAALLTVGPLLQSPRNAVTRETTWASGRFCGKPPRRGGLPWQRNPNSV